MTPDALEQLLRSLPLQRLQRRGSNWMACCPSHAERRPSWGIRVAEPHVFGCFACGFRGTLPRLLYHFGWSASAIQEYVQAAPVGTGSWQLNPLVETGPVSQTLFQADYYLPFQLELPAKQYLLKRGIPIALALRAGLAYSPLSEELLFPWRWQQEFYGVTSRPLGKDSSQLRRAYGNLQKRNLLYVPLATFSADRELWLVEGEIDALKLLALGCENVAALGHGAITVGQVRWLLNLPVNFSEVLLAFDHDTTGIRLTKQAAGLFAQLTAQLKVRAVTWSVLEAPAGKLDPGMLVDPAEVAALRRSARLWNSWQIFSA